MSYKRYLEYLSLFRKSVAFLQYSSIFKALPKNLGLYFRVVLVFFWLPHKPAYKIQSSTRAFFRMVGHVASQACVQHGGLQAKAWME
jgi:hypothetical protein